MRRAPAFLTDKLCDDAAGPEPGRHYVIYWDTEVRGFGYRKTAGPARGSFVLNYRNQNGVERRLTIGTHRDPWQVKAARKRALELKTLIDQGQDPQGEKNERRSAPRMNDLIERWRAEHKVKLRPRSQQQNEYLISQWLQPEFGTRLVADIEFGDIDRLHRKIGENGTPYRANRTVALASKLFTLAIKWKIRSDNPCRGVERYPETPRERHLIADELAALSRALDEDEDRQAADIFRLLLITGARKDELCSARRGQLHLEPDAEPPRGVWTKPATNTKQKKIHRVPLSPEAVTLFAKIVERSDVALMPSAYLFPHQDGYRIGAGHQRDVGPLNDLGKQGHCLRRQRDAVDFLLFGIGRRFGPHSAGRLGIGLEMQLPAARRTEFVLTCTSNQQQPEDVGRLTVLVFIERPAQRRQLVRDQMPLARGFRVALDAPTRIVRPDLPLDRQGEQLGREGHRPVGPIGCAVLADLAVQPVDVAEFNVGD